MSLDRVCGQHVESLVDHENGRRGPACCRRIGKAIIRLITVGLVVTLSLAMLSAGNSSGAQQAKMPRIGFVCWLTCGGPYYEAFWQAMRQLGRAQYTAVNFETRSGGGDRETLDFVAAELVRLKVDIIVADTTQSALAAKRATSTIPIVAISEDPVGSGLVPNLARPGGNVTGLSSVAPELGAKRLELLKKAFPKASRVAVLWDPANPVKARAGQAMESAAQTLGVTLLSLDARTSAEYESAFEAMFGLQADALVHAHRASDLTGMQPAVRISQLAMRYRLPAIYQQREFVEAGGLMSYGPDSADLFRRAAVYVDKILKGAKPADLPIEQPTRFELVINLKTAKELRVTVPRKILARADEVIE